ncbi:MAG: BrnT family toxin [Bryobacteraceae bacterium]
MSRTLLCGHLRLFGSLRLVYTTGVYLRFEWSPAKAKLNLRKHGIALEDAITAFSGSYVECADEREEYGEDRVVVLGEVNTRVVVIVYTWRGVTRRIISARKATKQEREVYYSEIDGSRPF